VLPFFVSDGSSRAQPGALNHFYCAPSWDLPLRGGALRHRSNQLSCGFLKKEFKNPKNFHQGFAAHVFKNLLIFLKFIQVLKSKRAKLIKKF